MGQIEDSPELMNGRRERSKAANRAAILAAGRATFAELGFEAATVRDIIRRTDLAAGTFYNYFRSKEEIYRALKDDSAARFREMLRSVRREAETFEDYVRMSFGAFFQLLHEENLEDGADMAARRPPVRTDTPAMRAVFVEVCDTYKDAIDRGLTPPFDVELLAAANSGLALELGRVMLSRRPRDIAGTTEFATNLVLCGLLKLAETPRDDPSE